MFFTSYLEVWHMKLLIPFWCFCFLFVLVDADYKMCSGRGRCSRKDLLTDLLHNQQVPLWICTYSKKISCETIHVNECWMWENPLTRIFELQYSQICLVSSEYFFPFQRFLTIMQWRWWLGENPIHLAYLIQQVTWICDCLSLVICVTIKQSER